MTERHAVVVNVVAGIFYLSFGLLLSLELVPLLLDYEHTHPILTSTLNPSLKVASFFLALVFGILFVVTGFIVLGIRRSRLALKLNIATGISASVFLVTLEAAARFGIAYNVAPLNSPAQYANGFCDEAFWKILLRASGAPTLPENIYHPQLGWTAPRTDQNPTGLAHGGPIGEGLALPFYGDSFMEGSTAAEQTVPAYVTNMIGQVRADNFGVGGYGVGQIMLRYQLTADRYLGRPVVIGIMTEDLDRTRFRVRSALKPAFVVTEEGIPKLTQIPVPRDASDWLEKNPIGIRSYAGAAIARVIEIIAQAYDASNSACVRGEKEVINRFALDQGRARSQNLDQTWIGVIFASPRAFVRRNDWRRQFLRSYFDTHEIAYVDSVDEIAGHAAARGSPVADYFLPDGHPNALGNKVIADALVVLMRSSVDKARAGGLSARSISVQLYGNLTHDRLTARAVRCRAGSVLRWKVTRAGVERVEGTGSDGKPESAPIRESLAVVGVERYGVSVKAYAEVLERSRVTVSSWVGRGTAKRAGENTFDKQVDELDNRIAKREP